MIAGSHCDQSQNLNHFLPQALLERFEFFPVKCRVQRALENSKIDLEQEKDGINPQTKFKTKVSPPIKGQRQTHSFIASSIFYMCRGKVLHNISNLNNHGSVSCKYSVLALGAQPLRRKPQFKPA